MENNYAKIVNDNLQRIFEANQVDLAALLPAERAGGGYEFSAFGEPCRIAPDGIRMSGLRQTGVPGILVSLYALKANTAKMVPEPFRAFKEFPGTTPYHGAFAANAERILVPHVPAVRKWADRIRSALGGMDAPDALGGDFSFTVRPFPKIALCYLFYDADEDFPASVTCLFSSNADRFMPNDGLADTAEYTSRKIAALSAETGDAPA